MVGFIDISKAKLFFEEERGGVGVNTYILFLK
jgi:hypothetical protein